MKDILEDFDEDYAEEDEDVFADDALEDEDEPEEAKALQEAAITQEEAGQEQDSQMKVHSRKKNRKRQKRQRTLIRIQRKMYLQMPHLKMNLMMNLTVISWKAMS